MKFNILIKGGLVVDGTGAAPRMADVRVSGGKIVEVAPNLERQGRERIVDATGCYVTPGFIETHNHYDAPMWWMPNLEPMSGYGITTSVNGNCGFAAAPVSDDPKARDAMVKIFSFFEDIPETPFKEILPWDWKSWPEYRRSMQRHLRIPVNFEFYAGHIAIRLAAMGLDATKRAATQEEIARMCAMLEEALEAGALGLSSNLLDYDGQGNPVPSLLAEDAEFEALLDVLARYENKTMEIVLGVFQRYTGVADMERVERLCKPRGIRVMWGGIPTLNMQMARLAALQDMHKRYREEGLEFYTAFHHVPPATTANFHTSLIFGQTNNLVWAEIVAEPSEAKKLAMLADPAWRARAREGWTKVYPQSPWNFPEVVGLSESESGVGPVGLSLADLVKQRGDDPHPSDALADWVLDNGIGAQLAFDFFRTSEPYMVELFRDPRAIGNISDSGAHGQMLCGIGDHIDLLAGYVRDKKLMTIEEAVHNITGKLADFFHLKDRGVIEAGRNADIVVFNLEEIERREKIKVFDVPDGKGARTWRYTRPAAPVRLTLVNGEPTFDRGHFSGNYPGTIAGFSTDEALARAAE